MTVEKVRERVAKIIACREDAEAAHSLEDDLYVDVLRAIVAGDCESPQEIAFEALKTQAFDFQRWCA